ncbi:hypothetical protein DYB36_011707, partial [Aphanomyces astaci]
WIRMRLHQKCVAIHDKPPPPIAKEEEETKKKTKKKGKDQKVLVNTGAYLAQASKMGVFGELVHVLLVVIDVLMKIE